MNPIDIFYLGFHMDQNWDNSKGLKIERDEFETYHETQYFPLNFWYNNIKRSRKWDICSNETG